MYLKWFLSLLQELQDRIQALTTERNDYQSITVLTKERIKEIEHAKQVNNGEFIIKYC